MVTQAPRTLDPVAALSPREVREVIEPLRRLRAVAAGGQMTADELLDYVIRRVALGLVRLADGPDLDLGEPSHFSETIR